MGHRKRRQRREEMIIRLVVLWGFIGAFLVVMFWIFGVISQ